VGGINELFQVIRLAISTAGCEEAVDLVSKTSIVRVLHDCHELDDIIAIIVYPWEDVLREFFVACNLRFRRGDSDMGFVDPDAERLWRRFILEDILLGWVPEPGIIYRGEGEVLCYSRDPGWNSFCSLAVVGYHQRDLESLATKIQSKRMLIYLDFGVMGYGRLPIFG
jgi:hypothetical protein